MYYTGPNPGETPILTLTENVSTWEIGDQIVVTATHYDPRETETFTIVECPECQVESLKSLTPQKIRKFRKKNQ